MQKETPQLHARTVLLGARSHYLLGTPAKTAFQASTPRTIKQHRAPSVKRVHSRLRMRPNHARSVLLAKRKPSQLKTIAKTVSPELL